MRNLIILFCFLGASLVALTLFVGVSKVKPKPVLTTIRPHMYNNKDISLEKITLTVFYFVPKDAVTKKQDNWKETLSPHLKKLEDFHNLQFENTSKITQEFFPEIIIGEKTEAEYGNLFESGSSDELVPIREEITRRVISSDGDLHTYFKEKNIPSVRNVYLIVFEGKGAAGNDDFCLISRDYLSSVLYKEVGSTFLTHEFYHTLGLPDNYQTSSYVYKDNEQVPISLLIKKDIMGQVNIPLPYTYIDTTDLKKMGL